MPPPHIVPKEAQEEGKAQESESGRPHPHKLFKVYVTGFGAFRDITINASYLIASSLPPVLEEKYIRYGKDDASTTNLQVSIIPHPEAVKVSYSNIEKVIPEIHKDYPGMDLFVHIGVAPIKDMQIEKRARRGEYKGDDVDGKTPEGHHANHAAQGKVPEGVEQLVSSLDLDGIQEYLTDLKKRNEQENFIAPRISEDAGLYLCEYTLYNSMAEAIYIDKYISETSEIGHTSHPSSDPPSTSRATFIHVPNEHDDELIERGRETVMRIIGAIAVQRATATV